MDLLTVRQLGLVDYTETFTAMKDLTDRRGPDTADEFWLLQHHPVFTLGLNADPSHVLAPGEIPVVQVDRGGQVTYHGPGQLVVYTLIDLKRSKLGIRDLVSALENSVIKLVAQHGIDAAARCDAPGVYVNGRKLASVGLRVRRGCSYHGLALNVSMETEPFKRINPCGFDDLSVTQLAELGLPTDIDTIGDELTSLLTSELGLDASA
ncbi:MAG: lipoyl(octanoyl) transferase LipB [Gammaproteobacteria bacterium]|nr:lipoyl(octanoyl) transferase LipB [Gammaproteobacteria bacterium]NND37160.1 lipoyl(octanoyl) transferase LipB [Gammaproteobacteria bacterium]